MAYPGYMLPYIAPQFEPPVASIANLASILAKTLDINTPKSKEAKDKKDSTSEKYEGTYDVARSQYYEESMLLRKIANEQAKWNKLGLDAENSNDVISAKQEIENLNSLSRSTWAKKQEETVKSFEARISSKENGGAAASDISGDYSKDYWMRYGKDMTYGDIKHGFVSTGNLEMQHSLLQQAEGITFSGFGDSVEFVMNKIKDLGPKEHAEINGGFKNESLNGTLMEVGGKMVYVTQTTEKKKIKTDVTQANLAYSNIMRNLPSEVENGFYSGMRKDNPGYFAKPGTKYKSKDAANNDIEIEVKAIEEDITPDNFDKYFNVEFTSDLNNAKHSSVGKNKKDQTVISGSQEEAMGYQKVTLKPEYTLRNKDGSANKNATENALQFYKRFIIAGNVNRSRIQESIDGSSTFKFTDAGDNVSADGSGQLFENGKAFIEMKNDIVPFTESLYKSDGTNLEFEPWRAIFKNASNPGSNSKYMEIQKFVNTITSDEFLNLNKISNTGDWKAIAERFKNGKMTDSDIGVVMNVIKDGDNTMISGNQGNMAKSSDYFNTAAKVLRETAAAEHDKILLAIDKKPADQWTDFDRRYKMTSVYIPSVLGTSSKINQTVEYNNIQLSTADQMIYAIDKLNNGIKSGTLTPQISDIYFNNQKLTFANMPSAKHEETWKVITWGVPSSSDGSVPSTSEVRNADYELKQISLLYSRYSSLPNGQEKANILNAINSQFAKYTKQYKVIASNRISFDETDFATFAQQAKSSSADHTNYDRWKATNKSEYNEFHRIANEQLEKDGVKKTKIVQIPSGGSGPTMTQYTFEDEDYKRKINELRAAKSPSFTTPTNPDADTTLVPITEDDGSGMVTYGNIKINKTAAKQLNIREDKDPDKKRPTKYTVDLNVNLAAYGPLTLFSLMNQNNAVVGKPSVGGAYMTGQTSK